MTFQSDIYDIAQNLNEMIFSKRPGGADPSRRTAGSDVDRTGTAFATIERER